MKLSLFVVVMIALIGSAVADPKRDRNGSITANRSDKGGQLRCRDIAACDACVNQCKKMDVPRGQKGAHRQCVDTCKTASGLTTQANPGKRRQ